MTIIVTYRIADGEITGVRNDDPPVPPEGCDLLFVDLPDGAGLGIDSSLHRVELQFDGSIELVDKSPQERWIASLPTRLQVSGTRNFELVRTDPILTTLDRPMTDEQRSEWIAYRQKLRDLPQDYDSSGFQGTLAMTHAFPTAPDGYDAAAALRARIQQ